jgi:hypothetical protein
MKLTNKDMVRQCMEKIELFQQQIANIETAARVLSEFRRHVTVDCGNLRNELIECELEWWRNLAMWGLTLDDAERDRIKAAVHARFLSGGKHVSHWMNDGVSPGSWLVADEDAFREMARKAFRPARDMAD